jgi:hypothetical protein
MFAPPRATLAVEQQRSFLWRSKIVRVVLLIGALVTAVVLLRLAAIASVRSIVYDLCMSDLGDATPTKCDCLARQMADHFVSYEQVKRRVLGREGLSDGEGQQMRRSCDV